MKFNSLLKRKAREPDTLNLAGGEAHAMSEKLELATIFLTAFLEDQFYRKADPTVARIPELIAAIPDKAFVAKAALHARHGAGMRSVSHLAAVELARQVKGAAWTKRFFERLVRRPDDVTEILACHFAFHGKPVPNALKKGLGAALARFDAHQISKYRGERAELKLVDAVNLLHPPHSEALAGLVRGTLAPAETWETQLTRAGQEAVSAEARAIRKAEAWTLLVRTRKIGYLALLRNLRNLLEQAPDLIGDAVAILTDATAIRRSLVMPFRYLTALEAVAGAKDPGTDERFDERRQTVLRALSVAADRALANVPLFDGRTLVAVDTSGSMNGKPLRIASLFAAVLYKANRADLMLFSNEARMVTFDREDATLSLAKRIEDLADLGGTNFHAIFEKADGAYERIVILSDMQAWIGHDTPAAPFARYVERVRKRPRVFSFDLAGHGSLQFPEAGVYALAGFGDKTMETLRLLESDRTALLREIERIDL